MLKFFGTMMLIFSSIIWSLTEVYPEGQQKAVEKITVFNAEKGIMEEVDKVYKTEEEWRKILTPEQYKVTRQKGTERAYTGQYWDNKKRGLYKCICCGNDLFSADTKFESGTGWPSFWQPVNEKNVRLEEDNGFFMKRIEVLCARCGAHLGHVFDDGPPPTHQRFCMNSAALNFIEKAQK